MNADLLAANLIAHWIQSGLLAGVSLLALAVLKVNEPRVRLASLQLVLAITLLLPWMQPRQPVAAPVPAATSLSSAAPDLAVAGRPAEPAKGAPLPADSASNQRPRLAAWLVLARAIPLQAIVAVALAGFGLRLLWLAYGLAGLSRFNRKAHEVSTPPAAEDLEIRLGVSPRYVQQTRPGGPSTFGFLRAIVALPTGYDSLPLSFQRAVICHELVHVKRRDVAVAFAEELAAAALWFHPWIWLLRARIRVAREQAVDQKVVTLLDNHAAYTRCLVELAGHDLAPHVSPLGAGMLRERELRARIDAMFQEVSMSRLRLSAVVCVLSVVLGATGWLAATVAPLHAAEDSLAVDVASGVSRTLTNPPEGGSHENVVTVPAGRSHATSPARAQSPVEALRKRPGTTAATRPAAQQVVATDTPRRQTKLGFAEYPQDALAKGIKGTVTVAINVGASGDVTSAAIVSGPQELRASAYKAAMGSTFEPGRSTTAMTIDVEYLLDRQSWGVRIVDRASSTASRVKTQDFLNQQAAGAERQDPAVAYRVGGAVRAPLKTYDVKPVYPDVAKAANVQGVVIIEVTIDERGHVSGTRVLRSIPLLDRAAVDAVTQWQFEPTLVNGVAVPVIMTVTVNFSTRTPSEQVRLRITLPDGSTPEVSVGANGGLAAIDAPGIGTLGFAALSNEGSVPRVTVAIYDMTRAVPGVAPVRLGTVEVTLGGGGVQSTTAPSIRIELISVTRP